MTCVRSFSLYILIFNLRISNCSKIELFFEIVRNFFLMIVRHEFLEKRVEMLLEVNCFLRLINVVEHHGHVTAVRH